MFRTVRNFLLIGPVAVTFYDNIGYPAVVEGNSMEPTLNPRKDKAAGNDVVFISRFAVRDYVVRRNDVVAMISPIDPNHRLIKRVIGVEGDTIKTRRYKDKYVDIPKGHFWVEGDNVNGQPLDSNVFGPVSTGLVIGRASHVLWPPSRWRQLETEDPVFRAPVARRPMPNILCD